MGNGQRHPKSYRTNSHVWGRALHGRPKKANQRRLGSAEQLWSSAVGHAELPSMVHSKAKFCFMLHGVVLCLDLVAIVS